LPRLESFSEEIDQLLDDNENVKECIRDFDKSISIKANKSQLKIMRGEFEERFIHNDKWIEVLKEFDEMENKFDRENDKLDVRFVEFKQEE